MPGSLRADLGISPGATLIGQIAVLRGDIPSILADLDLFVLAARSPEGVPQAILQAHAARVPLVATTVGGVREVAIQKRLPGVPRPAMSPDWRQRCAR